MARVPNVAPRKSVDTNEQTIGQDGNVTMAVTGPAALERPAIQGVDGPGSKSFLEELAFADEMVTVEVSTTTDKNAEPLVQVWNDGRHQLFPRGMEVTCKRKFIEVLARAKQTSYRNEEYRDADGNNSVRWPSTTSLKYPFRVVRDDNPRGAAWLKKILAEK